MKKILSLILCLAFIAGTFTFAQASAYNIPENAEEIKGLLMATGIINEEFEISGRNLSRGEFTSLVIKASGLSDYISDKIAENSFSDVAADNPYAPYIAAAKQRGYTFGYSDGTFRPDETISFIEAVVYIIRLMGYTDIAEAKMGFPVGYLTTADYIGIIDGLDIPMDTPLTSEIAVHLLFNALNSRVMEINSYNPDGNSFKISYGNYLMYQSFGIDIIKGVMDEVDISALIGLNDLSPYTVSVNGVIIDIGKLSPNYLLGYNVTAYYKYEKSKNILVYVSKDASKNNLKRVKISDITNIANQTVTATDSTGKTSDYKYKSGAAILYNGVATKAFFNTSIYVENGVKLQGYVELLDNNGDNIADVVNVDAYEEFIAGKKSTNDKVLYDKNNPKNSVVLDTITNDPYTIIFDENGEEISLSKIASGMSVIIKKSKQAYQGYIKVLVSSKNITGTLEAKYEENGGYFVTMNGTEYPLTAYGNKYYNSDFYGKNVTAVLNAFGEVCYIEESSDSGAQLGVLKGMKVAANEHDKTIFYIYSEKGEDIEVEPAKWIKVDNDTYNGTNRTIMATVKGNLDAVATEYASAPAGSNKMNIIILYTINNEGKLASIDTAYDKDSNGNPAPAIRAKMDSGNSLIAVQITTDDTCVRNTYNDVIGKKIIIDEASKVFFYPKDDSLNGYWTATADSVFNNLGTYNAIAYYADKDSVSPDAYIMCEDSSVYFHTSSSGYMSMVLKVTDTVNSEGIASKKIYMYHNNELVTYYCDASLACECGSSACGNFKAKDLAPGDIIYAGIDELSDGLEKFYIRFDASANMIYHNDNATGTTNRKGQRLTVGFPYLATDKGIHYVDMFESSKDAASFSVASVSSATVESLYNSGSFHISDLTSGIPITIFDKNKKGDYVVSPGTAGDILSYLEVEGDCSKLIIHTYANNSYTLTRGIYIIREARQ